jgi:hypothetical protein
MMKTKKPTMMRRKDERPKPKSLQAILNKLENDSIRAVNEVEKERHKAEKPFLEQIKKTRDAAEKYT